MADIERAIRLYEDMVATDKNDTIAVLVLQALKEKAERNWIKCSDRMPKVDKYGEAYVLVSMDDEFIATTTYVKDDGFELWAESGEVVAWQPLPEPYKESDTQ